MSFIPTLLFSKKKKKDIVLYREKDLLVSVSRAYDTSNFILYTAYHSMSSHSLQQSIW